jgi:integrase
MTDTHQQFDVFHDPNADSLAEALAKFEALPDETPSRKARVRAAVATFGRLLHKPAEAIPAQAKFMKNRFTQLKHRPTGLSAKSVANCKSELRYMVELVCNPGRRSEFRPLAPDWIALRDAITEERRVWKLSRIMAFASASGTTPRQVDDAFIDRFRSAVVESGDVPLPEQHVRQAIHAWNAIASSLPDQGLSPLHLAARRVPRWTIEPTQFPAAFREDVEAWLTFLSTVDPEGEEGPIRALRPGSLRVRRHQVFKAASALVFAGRPIETVTALADLVDIDAFRTILKHLRERRGGAPSPALHGLSLCLMFIAKHQVRVDAATLQRMRRICANYKVSQEERTSRNHARLMNFDDHKLLAALVHLPERLIEEAARPRTSPTKARRLAQIAIAIEIELHAPMRLANLVSLNLQRNIQVITVDGETRWVLRFDRHETKNRAILAYELNGGRVKFIGRAFKFYGQTNGWLFPGADPSHKQSSLFGKQIKQEVERRLGQPFNVHMFRGLVASLQVQESNNGFEVGRAMLGDRSDKVIRAHYTKTAERHLIAQGQETIRRVRVRTAPLVAKR